MKQMFVNRYQIHYDEIPDDFRHERYARVEGGQIVYYDRQRYAIPACDKMEIYQIYVHGDLPRGLTVDILAGLCTYCRPIGKRDFLRLGDQNS